MINYLEPDFDDSPGQKLIFTENKFFENLKSPADVSIITPFFNTEALFVETWISVVNQTFKNWEWLIVDDGSTNKDSLAHLKELSGKDKRIKVIHQENAGPGAARNAGFDNSIGKYIFLLDSDDMVEPTYIEKCVWFLESNTEFAFCNSHSVIFGEEKYLWSTGFERGKAHLQANSGPPISMIRRTAYAECGGFDASIRFGHEDWDFWLAMAKSGHWGYTLSEFLQWYRKRSNGRFEEIMRTDGTNDAFEKRMLTKYSGLEKNFPEPVRQHPVPYATIPAKFSITNKIDKNSQGRNILFIVPWMVTGGADRVNLDLIEGLTLRGHNVTICATLIADHRWEHEFSKFTSDIFILPNIIRVADYPRFLNYIMDSRNIDTVVITGSTVGYQLLPYLRSVSKNVAFLDMCHVEEPHWLNGGHPRFGVGYQELLDLNIVTTQYLAEWMQVHGADPERLKVMYTGVRTSNIYKVQSDLMPVYIKLNINPSIPVIVFAGRICEQKRPMLLASILKSLHDDGVEFQALIIGDGDLKADFEAFIKKNAMEKKIHMLGSVAHVKWLEILGVADVFLMPSQYEGISIALLEAMAAGVVPVVANVGGQAEIVSPDVGFLISQGPHELTAYVDALRGVLSNAEKWNSMSKQCCAMAESKFSWSLTIDNFLKLIDEAHQLRLEKPRSSISLGFGREMAALSAEYKRLSDAVDWLWHSRSPSALSGATALTLAADAQAITRFAIAFSQTSVGLYLIHNKLIKTCGRWLLKIMLKSKSV